MSATATNAQIHGAMAEDGHRRRDNRVRYARSKRGLTSGVVIRRFTPGTEPPPLHHPLDLLAIAPRGKTVEL
jgi:hypothetical protein